MLPSCLMASRAAMYISMMDNPPRLLTIRATEQPEGRGNEQDESLSVIRFNISSMMLEAVVIWLSNYYNNQRPAKLNLND